MANPGCPVIRPVGAQHRNRRTLITASPGHTHIVGPRTYSRNMTSLALMNATSATQIAPYPRGDLPQNTFRAVLYDLSMHALGKNATFPLKEAYVRAVRAVAITYPNFTPTRA